MPTPVLATKLFVPARRQHLLDRPRLVRRLDAGLVVGHKLTIVAAPAGFGKTTLVSDWVHRRRHRQPTAPIAWLSLDDLDDDPARFLTHLVAALQGVDEQIGAEAQQLLHDAPTVPVEATLTALINDLARTSETTRIVLVLDDYHIIHAAPVHEALTFLLDHLPPQLGLIVVGRADPPLPLARLRARHELTEIRADDLRCTDDEAQRFLEEVMGLPLADADVDAIEARTEGWIAGLQLAALALQDRDDTTAFIDAFTGSHRYVIDYLVEEVLQQQSDELRRFLLETSILDRLTGSLCDALTGRDDGSAMLGTLERANLFVVPLDDRREWYRYHHLFADVLSARMLSERPDRLAELHQRASAWHEQEGSIDEAVRHALAAQDFERAAHLMELAVPTIRRDRTEATLLNWLQALPDDVVRRRPVLGVFYGWMMLVTGEVDAVEPWLDDAERALADGAGAAASSTDTEELRGLPATIEMFRASVAQARGDAAATSTHARRALELADPTDHRARGGALGFLGLAAWAEGDVETALETFSDAVASLHAAGNLTDEYSSTTVLADLWLAAGRPSEARRVCERALRQATEHGGAALAAAADLHVSLSELDRELGRLDAATDHLESARSLTERASMSERRFRWFVAMAQVTEATGDAEAAIELLEQAERLYRPGFFPEVRPIGSIATRIRIAHGDLVGAADWVRRRGLSPADALTYLREFDHLTLVRLLIARYRAQRDDAAIEDAVELLRRLREAAEGSRRVGSLVEIQVLQALAHGARGDEARGIEALDEVMATSPEPEGYVRLFLDEGEPMVSLLRYADDRGLLDGHARRLLAAGAAGAPNDAAARAAPSLSEPLSERELQVLRMLHTELSGPDIAKELFVSVNTLRTHTKHIFTKLGVTSRRAAIRRAQELGLL